MKKLFRITNLIAITTIVTLSLVISTVPVDAFTYRIPDPADTTTGSVISLYSGRTQFVRQTNADYRIWFPTTTGQLVINNYHFCLSNTRDFLQQNDYYDLNGFPGAIPVTDYIVNNGTATTYTGNRYASTNAACDDNLTINLTLTNRDPNNSNFYYADIDVNFRILSSFTSPPPFEGIQNGYTLTTATAGAYIGTRSGSSGYSSTQAQVDTVPNYVTYTVPFGTRCNAVGDEEKTLDFYDIDNAGGGGAQPAGPNVYIVLRDLTQNAWVNIGGDGTGYGTNVTWTLPNNNNSKTSRTFTARPNHKYELEIRDVYYNNMIQYSVPYPQISSLPCPKAATYTTSVGADTTIDAVAGGSATFTNQVTTGSLLNIASETFSYTVTTTGSGVGATWGADATTYPRTGVPVAPAGNKAAVANRTLTIAPGSTALIGTSFCRSIQVTATPAGVNNTITAPNLKQQCVRITGNSVTAITGFVGGTDHEKGSGDKATTHGISNTSEMCVGAVAIGGNVTVEVLKQIGGTITKIADVVMPNCQPFGGYTSPPQTISAATLDAIATGNSLAVNTIIRYAGTDIATDPDLITVYEAPFTRFYGNDVAICADADTNRFVFDNRTTLAAGASPISNAKGSFAEYATIYSTGNNASNTAATGENMDNFSGLNSSFVNAGFPTALDTNWGGAACTSGISASDFSGATVDTSATLISNATADTFATKKTYNITGNVTIGEDIFITPPGGTFNPSTYPVVLIYATGNINISSAVNELNAVLVAGGTINTCTASDGSPIAKASLDNTCNTPLRINGAVSATTINFQRAVGTRLLADTAAPNGSTAEIIDYPWYLNFVNFELNKSTNSTFDAYYTLPPRL